MDQWITLPKNIQSLQVLSKNIMANLGYIYFCWCIFWFLSCLGSHIPYLQPKKQHTQMSYLQNSFDLYSIAIHIPYIDLSGGSPAMFFSSRKSSWKNQPGDGFPTCRNWFTRIHPPPPGLRLWLLTVRHGKIHHFLMGKLTKNKYGFGPENVGLIFPMK